MTRALEGLTVVSVEQAVAAPYASSRLADAGARVIKVERPDGDFARAYDSFVKGQSAYYVWLNRGKESVRLDLKQEIDRLHLQQLIGQADVFLQNLKPGSIDKLGFSQAALQSRFPKLILCEISGFGTDGHYSHLKAYDLIVQAEAGLCSITGTPEDFARVGVSVCDIAAGMNAHAAILEALIRRQNTGQGSAIQISLFDAVADWMNVPLLQLKYGNYENQRCGVNHPTIAPYGAYRCSDDKSLIFSVQNKREWISFCHSFLGCPEIATDPKFHDNMSRLANRAELDALVVPAFLKVDSETAMARLEEAGIAYGRLNGLRDVLDHPHLRLVNVATPNGDVEIVAPAPIVNGARFPKLGAVATLGDSDAVLETLGQSDPPCEPS